MFKKMVCNHCQLYLVLNMCRIQEVGCVWAPQEPGGADPLPGESVPRILHSWGESQLTYLIHSWGESQLTYLM